VWEARTCTFWARIFWMMGAQAPRKAENYLKKNKQKKAPPSPPRSDEEGQPEGWTSTVERPNIDASGGPRQRHDPSQQGNFYWPVMLTVLSCSWWTVVAGLARRALGGRYCGCLMDKVTAITRRSLCPNCRFLF
jgi:hypothetical protein